MKNQALIKQTQPVIYQTLTNAFNSGKVNHAFLLSGVAGSPIKESAIYLAQSLVCENHNPLACEECISCLRIANGSYGTIKKEEIELLQSSFSKSAVESKGLKVYIIHLLEKATASAVNSLLKFLEEPYDDVVAILTTENQALILDTIVSRCQVLRIKSYSKDYLKQELANNNLEEEDINILVNMYSDLTQILDVLNNSDFKAVKELVINTFDLLVNNLNKLNYYATNQLQSKLKDKQNVNLFLDLLETIIADVVRLKVGEDVLFSSQKQLLELASANSSEFNRYKELIILAQGSLSLNLNTALLLDALFYKLRFEKGV